MPSNFEEDPYGDHCTGCSDKYTDRCLRCKHKRGKGFPDPIFITRPLHKDTTGNIQNYYKNLTFKTQK